MFLFFAHNPIEYKHFLKKSFLPIDETLTGPSNLSQSGPGSNGNEGVLHTPQSSRNGASPSIVVKCHTWDINSIWPIDGTQTGPTTLSQSGPGSNGHEGVLYIPKIFRIEASPSNAV